MIALLNDREWFHSGDQRLIATQATQCFDTRLGGDSGNAQYMGVGDPVKARQIQTQVGSWQRLNKLGYHVA